MPTSPCLPNLATSLNNLSIRLGDVGRRAEGLAAVEEALAIRRTLAEANPDAYLPDLASSLNNLSVDLGDLGRGGRRVWRSPRKPLATTAPLAEANPDAYLPDLATSLNNLSIHLVVVGRRAESGFIEQQSPYTRHGPHSSALANDRSEPWLRLLLSGAGRAVQLRDRLDW
ncbi:tetratricopeptide repeat protein [Streptomyces sp. NPDC057680]|uniref:tetratricopeptide repeat protein n=1 Tax=Streptomyces sp. NPDC057680 TaxID=3346208 RepID=UPI0036BF19A4